MRKLSALIFSFICFSVLGQANVERVKLPDFAYPQDVIKTAEELIKSSNGDERILGALELLTAKASADYESLPEMMKNLMNLADVSEDPAPKSLLKLLAAQTGFAFEMNDSLVIDYFDKKFEPYKATNKLRSIADTLLKEAIEIAPPTPLSTYNQAMGWNEIGLSVMPTVRDFVAWHAVYPTDLLNPKRELVDIALKATGDNSPINRALKEKIKLPSQNNEKYKFMLNLLDGRSGDYALYLFIKSLSSRSELSDKQIEPELDFLRQAKQKVTGSWVEETVDARIRLLEAPYYVVDFPNNAFSFTPVTITLTGYNTDRLTLNLYKFKSEKEALDAWKSGRKLEIEPYISKTYTFNNSITGDKKTMTKDLEPGHYLIDVQGDISKEHSYRNPIFTIFPWSIIGFDYNSNDESIVLQALDSKTSRPLPRLQVVVEDDDK
ncbi:MAG: hypothetical protein K2K84_03710, partial [Muribaculaceae bacterium]|nr:hypothetical protein [Muribaculaceae bacterium]